MKKKILIFAALAAITAFFAYHYAYKSQRDISSETAIFELSVKDIQTAFSTNDSLANKKYLDKTITIYGKITNLDSKTNSIVLDDKVYVTFLPANQANLALNQEVKIKGRFIGFDDLIEEFRIDQGTVVK